jgi:GNAT superfamily N-acetyltransferase
MVSNPMTFKIDDILLRPLTPSIWEDFELLFGPRGAYAGCWCMWWRLSRKEFEKGQGDANRRAMKSIVESGQIPGLLAYSKGEPCAWCSVAPREQFGSLERSRVLKRVDNKDVWSIVCFFVDRNYRGKNLSLKLILGAIEYVKSRGGEIIEAYPSIIRSAKAAPVSTFMGIPKIFEKAGFKAVHTPSKSKLIMRYFIT